MSETVINTSKCKDCRYGTINDENRARVKVICSFKEKEYYYGQCVPCEYFEKRYMNEED